VPDFFGKWRAIRVDHLALEVLDNLRRSLSENGDVRDAAERMVFFPKHALYWT